jgi:hypothetical protein
MEIIGILISALACAATVICTIYTTKTYYKVYKIEKNMDNKAIEMISSIPRIKEVTKILNDMNGNVFFMTDEYEEYYEIAVREAQENADVCPIVGRYRYYKKDKKLYEYDCVENEYKRVPQK